MNNVYVPLLFAAALTLSGCSRSAAVISGNDAIVPVTEPSSSTSINTADSIRKMAEESKMHAADIADRKADDLSEEAVSTYFNLMKYASNFLGSKSYSLYDFRKTDSGYYVKIVLDDYIASGDDENAPIMISSDFGGYRLKSGLAGFVYSREWTQSLIDEVYESYPTYHLNTYSLESDNEYLSIDRGEETYNLGNIGRELMAGTWSVNMILPVGTEKPEFERAYAEIEPILKKYSVNQLTVVVPDSKESYDRMLSDEKITGNCYFDNDTGIDWRDIYGSDSENAT
ncbi:MAG: hypothetical protein J6Y71_10625 [Ruminococcus sp.]|nr:hypothetical protein [Ruminococcus sp.]